MSMEFTFSIRRPRNLRPSRAESDDSLTVNKLRFSSLGLCGGDKEMAKLKKRLEIVTSEDNQRHLVLISGYSGAGKTALSSTLKPRVKKTRRGVR
jgi:transcriptional regulator with GAF, ATPase, and Fis domain